MASVPPVDPDPPAAADDGGEAAPPAGGEPGRGVSSPDPAEGRDDEPGELPGSPRG